jgi:hypothetical protein
MMNPKKSLGQAGFTILLAALVTSLVITLGISIFSIAQKQVILSSLGRNSQYAFYTADTAAECALYWDVRHDFASTTGPISPISCGGDADVTVSHSALNIYPIAFDFEFEPNGYCARVSVTKNNVHPRTVIHADGFSTICDDIEVSGRALQRSVEISY